MVELTAIVQTGLGAVAGVGLSLTDTWQALIGDRIAAWRLTNALKMQPKIDAELKKAGVKLNAAKVPDRYAFAWFEEATKQDEDEIQELFAKLLAQAAAGNEDALDRRLLEIVTRMTPDDAKVFKAIYDNISWKRYEKKSIYLTSWSWENVRRAANGAIVSDPQKTIEHLTTIGLMSEGIDLDIKAIGAAISSAFQNNRPPDIRNIQLKHRAEATQIGISLYVALYPEVIEQSSL
jgi:hypothetical protein